MKSTIKMILVVLLIFICLIVLDTVQAKIFKNTPVISWRENLDDENFVIRGIIMDTYYCVKDEKTITVNWEIKSSRFECPLK